jgi:hypothetical protein
MLEENEEKDMKSLMPDIGYRAFHVISRKHVSKMIGYV